MQAIVFEQVGSVTTTSIADPILQANTDAIIAIEMAGLCGSDMHTFLGREPGLAAGTVMGHEAVGIVQEVGSAVKSFKPGDRVSVPFTVSCGHCPPCQSGLTARCHSSQLFGWRSEGKGLHGLQAEYARIPLADTTLVKIPAAWDATAAIFLGDVLATGYFAWQNGVQGLTKPRIAIVGAGPVGLCAALSAIDQGTVPVVFDLLPHRLQQAEDWGAQAINASDFDLGAHEATYDTVIEAVGNPKAQELAFNLVRPGGTLSTVGVHTAPHFSFSPGQAYDKNLTFKIGRCPARGLSEPVSKLLDQNRQKLGALVSHQLPLAEAKQAYEILQHHSGGCGKIAFVVS